MDDPRFKIIYERVSALLGELAATLPSTPHTSASIFAVLLHKTAKVARLVGLTEDDFADAARQAYRNRDSEQN